MKRTIAIVVVGLVSLLVISSTARADSRCKPVRQLVQIIGTAAATVPATAVGAKEIIICNSAENGGTALIKCRADGATPVMSSADAGTIWAGDVLAKGACVTYSPSAALIKCISDAAGTAITTSECR